MSRIVSAIALSLLFGTLLLPAHAQEKEKNRIEISDSSQDDGSAPGEKARTHRYELVSRASTLGPSGMTPAQMRSVYNLPSTGGQGIIAIVDAFDYPTALNDFNVFSSQFGLPMETSGNATSSSNKVFQVVYQGGHKPKVNASWGQEAALDIEWAHAMAPGAKIILVEAQNNQNSSLFAAVDVAKAIPGVTQISMSWGSNTEYSGETSNDTHFIVDPNVNSNKIVFFVSSGDAGAGTSYPAVSPLVVCVGGTSVAIDGSGVVTETGWSGSGGGISSFVARPGYQDGIASLVGLKRGIPDISSNADPRTGVSVYDSTPSQGRSGWLVFGGTSVSAPCMAGMVNLSSTTYANSAAFLTAVYASTSSPFPSTTSPASNFRDIVSGSNGGFSCQGGFDFVTGFGSPWGTGF